VFDHLPAVNGVQVSDAENIPLASPQNGDRSRRVLDSIKEQQRFGLKVNMR
jgi:hypothetical protein